MGTRCSEVLPNRGFSRDLSQLQEPLLPVLLAGHNNNVLVAVAVWMSHLAHSEAD